MRPLSRVEVAERMTAKDFFRRAPEDRKAELIDGVMIMPAPPSDKHGRLVGFLFTLLRMFSEEHDRGEVRGSRTAVELPDATGALQSIALPGFRLRSEWLWPQDKFVAVREALSAMGAE